MLDPGAAKGTSEAAKRAKATRCRLAFPGKCALARNAKKQPNPVRSSTLQTASRGSICTAFAPPTLCPFRVAFLRVNSPERCPKPRRRNRR